MSRAGWSAGVLSASKLCHSVSIQGPVRTSKPRPWKIVLDLAAHERQRVQRPQRPAPRRQRDVDGARQVGGQRRLVQRARAASPTARLDRSLGAVGGLADRGRASAGSRPSAFISSETRPFLPR